RASTSPECLPIDSTTACSPLAAGLSINTTALSTLLIQPSGGSHIATVADWESAVIDASNNTHPSFTTLLSDLGCSGDPVRSAAAFRLHRTLLCVASVYVYSAGCNVDAMATPQAGNLMCASTMWGMAGEVVGMFKEPSVCPVPAPAEAIDMRENVWKAVEASAVALGKLEASVRKAGKAVQCVNAVDSDQGAAPPSPAMNIRKVGFNHRLVTPSSHPSTNKIFVKAADGETSSSSAVSLPLIIGVSIGGVVLVAGLLTVVLRRRRATSPSTKQPRGLPRGATVQSRNPGAAAAFSKTMGSDASSAPLKAKGTLNAGASLVRVKHPYNAELPDEVDLKVGDLVEVERRYDDDWGKGLNTRTGIRGHFPLAVLGAE
ncbi:hypothetical protein HK101_002744, partial [Irineochytrium annulatum]